MSGECDFTWPAQSDVFNANVAPFPSFPRQGVQPCGSHHAVCREHARNKHCFRGGRQDHARLPRQVLEVIKAGEVPGGM